MVILVDTSALYALADTADHNHAAAKRILHRLEDQDADLVLHTYVLAETFALLHRRHGLAIAARMSRDTAPLRTVAVDRLLHDEAVSWLQGVKRNPPSLVDAVSFRVMDREGIRTAFAFDPDFTHAGFELATPA